MLTRLAPYLLLTALALVFFAGLVIHPGQILYSDHSDFVVQYLPAKHFLVRSWQTDGELPLWCPEAQAGLPFVHDPQVAAFYPPNAPLYFLPDRWIGPAMSWLLVAHVILAGCGAYVYARSHALGIAGSLVAGLGFMFGGKWMLHLLGAGHHTFAPIAWLPLVVLFLEQALRRAGNGKVLAALVRAAWAGALFGVMALGAQPQLTFYAGLFLAVWTLGPALGGATTWRQRRRALFRWAGLGGWTAVWAVGLYAVQLLPTLEAAPYTTRAVTGAVEPGTVARALVHLIGPSLAGASWDYQAGLGLLWVVTAVLAPFLVRGPVRFWALATGVLVLFALGGAVLDGLPGFKLFRIPPRMFLIAAFPISLLAGTATQALFTAKSHAGLSSRCRRVAVLVVVLLLLTVLLQALLLLATGQALHFHPYWAALAVLVPAALWLPGRLAARPTTALRIAWVGLLLLDLWALGWPLVAVWPEEKVYAPTQSVDFLTQHAGHDRVLDRDAPARADQPSLLDANLGNTPLGYAQPLLRQIEAVRGLNPIDVYRYKQYVRFISGSDEPLKATGGIENFPIKNRPLLDLLGTRYLVQPSALKPEGPGWEAVATDSRPVAFGNVVGGMQALPPYTIYRNAAAFPRAFLVPTAESLPADRQAERAALLRADLHRTVFLEGAPRDANDLPGADDFGDATIAEYRPNRVTIELKGRGNGYLVLTDVWYPGWTCQVDGQPAELYRADYIFRAVRIPEGAHRVEFHFDPASYRRGRWISAVTLGLLAALTLVGAVRTRRLAGGG